MSAVAQRRASHREASSRAGPAAAARPPPPPDGEARGRARGGGWLGAGCALPRRPVPPQIVADGAAEGVALPARLAGKLGLGRAALLGTELDRTEFVAETLLPTRTGKYRLRGYRHTVGRSASVCFRLLGPGGGLS